jgi:cell division protein FtsB
MRRPSPFRRRRAGARPTGRRPRAGTGPSAATTRNAARSAGRGVRGGDGARRGRGSLTGRAAVLALVVCALLLSLAYPLREFFAQRADIAALRQKVATQKQQVAQLEAAKARWSDPAYVKAQARDRLHFVMPGETQYVVVGPTSGGTAAKAPTSAAEAPDQAKDDAWFQRLWQSTQAAGRS